MRHVHIFLGLIVGLGLVAMPVYAMEQTAGTEMPTKTLADFQKEYPGKAIVSWYHYQEYRKALRTAPRPTLETSRMRNEEVNRGEKTLADFQRENPGKSIIAWNKYDEYKKLRK